MSLKILQLALRANATFAAIRLRQHLESRAYFYVSLGARDRECYLTFSCASTFTWLTASIRPTTSPKLLWIGARTDIQPGFLATATRRPVFNTVSISGTMPPYRSPQLQNWLISLDRKS